MMDSCLLHLRPWAQDASSLTLPQDISLLGNLVRLADYLVVEGSLQLLQATIEDMTTTMETTPIIITQLSFALDDQMVFNANEDEIRQVSHLTFNLHQQQFGWADRRGKGLGVVLQHGHSNCVQA